MARPPAALLALAAALALSPAAARAALGARFDALGPEHALLSARVTGEAALSTHRERVLAVPGAEVRELATQAGVVFAVAWRGVAEPDLSLLLGAYHGDYQSSRPPPGPRRGMRALRVRGREVVVETWGRLRDLHGFAWVPALVPAGVDLDALR